MSGYLSQGTLGGLVTGTMYATTLNFLHSPQVNLQLFALDWVIALIFGPVGALAALSVLVCSRLLGASVRTSVKVLISTLTVSAFVILGPIAPAYNFRQALDLVALSSVISLPIGLLTRSLKMKIAITGGTGFVGQHLAARLSSEGHEVVLLARNAPEAQNAPFIAGDLSDVYQLAKVFAECDAVAHCAGINRELGRHTYQQVHIEGTKNVVGAAYASRIKKIVLMSFLRARPNCGSPYHESKWEAEEIVRNSGLDYTVIKAGVVFGRGDHMLDHLSHALYTFPIFPLVGLKDQACRPLAVEDLVQVMRAALIDMRLRQQTVAVVGAEEIYLREAVRRVAAVVGKEPLIFPLPVWCHRIMARVFELTMKTPLASLAQVRILSEGLVEPATPVARLPYDLIPTRKFTPEQIRNGLPSPAPFCAADLRWCA